MRQIEPELINPLGEFLLVRPEEPDELTKGGILLPENARNQGQARVGMVLRVGSGKLMPDGRRIPIEVIAGDRVLYKQHLGHKLPDGELMLLECDLLAKILG